MEQEPLPGAQSRVFILGFDDFSFYFLPRRSRIVSRRAAPVLEQPGDGEEAAAAEVDQAPAPLDE